MPPLRSFLSSRRPRRLRAVGTVAAGALASLTLAACVVTPPSGDQHLCWKQGNSVRCVPITTTTEAPPTTEPGAPARLQPNFEWANAESGLSTIGLDDVSVVSDGATVYQSGFGTDGAVGGDWVDTGNNGVLVARSGVMRLLGDSVYAYLDLDLSPEADTSVSFTVADLPASAAGEVVTVSLETFATFDPDVVVGDDGSARLDFTDPSENFHSVPLGTLAEGDEVSLVRHGSAHVEVLVNGSQVASL